VIGFGSSICLVHDCSYMCGYLGELTSKLDISLFSDKSDENVIGLWVFIK